MKSDPPSQSEDLEEISNFKVQNEVFEKRLSQPQKHSENQENSLLWLCVSASLRFIFKSLTALKFQI